ncbi:MAG: transcriptional repressor [Bacteroidales bacterium]|jgi:Fe2+ or Zn2+ uptake regulation protein|nr:transcriptional repressor [Bacteroidales bacterium]
MKGRSTGIPDVIQFKRLLRDRDLKATPQRMAVHEAMCALVHGSADDVAAWIAAQGTAKISAASVYNILTLLADLGVYGRRSGRGGKMVFDVRTGRHLHLYDTESGTWRDLEDEALLTWMEAHFKGRRFRGYKIDGFEVQLLCHPTRKGPGRKA